MAMKLLVYITLCVSQVVFGVPFLAQTDGVRCGDCRIDWDHPSCDSSTWCYGDKPLCMTSFYSDGNFNLTQIKRCASIDECSDLWWIKTSPRPDCMGDNDPYSWPGDKSGQCHYCCLTPQGESRDWCNKAMWPTKPRNLVDMDEYTQTTSVESTATEPTTTAPVAKGETTEQITQQGTTIWSKAGQILTAEPTTVNFLTTVPETTPIEATLTTISVLNTEKVTEAISHDLTTIRSKTDQTTTTELLRPEPITTAPDITRLFEATTLTIPDVTTGKVIEPLIHEPTTVRLKAGQIITYEPTPAEPATTEFGSIKIETTMPATTDLATETVTLNKSTTVGPSNKLIETAELGTATVDAQTDGMRCGDCSIDWDHPSCDASTWCYGDTPLCMTSFYSDGNFNLTQVKRCASIDECSDLWWSKTSPRPDCMGDNDPYSWPGDKSGQCHYCCHTPQGESRDWCNKAMWPTKPRNLVNMDELNQRFKTTLPTPSIAPTRTATTAAVETTTDKPSKYIRTGATAAAAAAVATSTTTTKATGNLATPAANTNTNISTRSLSTTEITADNPRTIAATTWTTTYPPPASTTTTTTTNQPMAPMTTMATTNPPPALNTTSAATNPSTRMTTTKTIINLPQVSTTTTINTPLIQTTTATATNLPLAQTATATTANPPLAQATTATTTNPSTRITTTKTIISLLPASTTTTTTTHQPQAPSTTTTTATIEKPSSPRLRCAVCQDDPSRGTSCRSGRVETCPGDKPFCMSTLEFGLNLDGGLVTRRTKKCASFMSCLSSIINNQMCYGDTTSPSIGRLGARCNFCCYQASGFIPCNAYDRPIRTISFLPKMTQEANSDPAAPPPPAKTTETPTTKAPPTRESTTTAQPTRESTTTAPLPPPAKTTETPTATAPPTTTAKTTETPTATAPPTRESTTTAPPPRESTTTAPPTRESTTTTAPPIKESTTAAPPARESTTTAPPTRESTTTAPPTRESTRESTTTTAPSARESTTTAPPTRESTTTAPPATTTAPPTRESTTTSLPTTASTTTSPPATTAATTIAPTDAVIPRSCVQCGSPASSQPCTEMELLLSDATPCASGLHFCMNHVYENVMDKSRKVYKRCIDKARCVRFWHERSAKNVECVQYKEDGAVTSNLSCHFCCADDGCNSPIRPSNHTLWGMN